MKNYCFYSPVKRSEFRGDKFRSTTTTTIIMKSVTTLCSCVFVFLSISISSHNSLVQCQRTRSGEQRFFQGQRNGFINSENPGQPLVLTPFINNGSVRVARELSRVRDMAATESYSGFLVVNQNYNSNLFFWFFPSQVSTYRIGVFKIFHQVEIWSSRHP